MQEILIHQDIDPQILQETRQKARGEGVRFSFSPVFSSHRFEVVVAFHTRARREGFYTYLK